MDKTFVINWHLTEACNYSCQFCFAKWEHDKKDLIKDLSKAKFVIDELVYAFQTFIQPQWGFNKFRINFAGGEPSIYAENLNALIFYCKLSGIQTSMITNGSFLHQGKVDISQLDMLGISIDSLSLDINEKIGRIDSKTKKFLELDWVVSYLNQQKTINPQLSIKLNTVVNVLNYQEDMSYIIDVIKPDKWKVFKMLPVVTSNLEITQEQFEFFLEKHSSFIDIITSENNDEMAASYLMLDPKARFYSHKKKGVELGYLYSDVITDIGFMQALSEINFDLEKFNNRY